MSDQRFQLKQNVFCPDADVKAGVLQVALKGEDEDEIYYYCRTKDGGEGWFHQDSLVAD